MVPVDSGGRRHRRRGLEAALKAGPVKLVHLIPNFHNPAGCTLSAEKRERVLELAAEHGFWVFEDDPYRELPFEQPPPPTMLSGDGAGRVIHASSFSKTVSPGVRVGYLAGPEEEIAKLVKRANETTSRPTCSPSRSSGSCAAPVAWKTNIEFVRGALAGATRRSGHALDEKLPEAEFVVPGGGYFLWLTLEEGHRQRRPAGGEPRGAGQLHRRPRLHARGRREQPAPLLRAGPRRAESARASSGSRGRWSGSAPRAPRNARTIEAGRRLRLADDRPICGESSPLFHRR